MSPAAAAPRRRMAALVLHLQNAGIELERLERDRHELTGPGELVGVWDIRRRHDELLAKAREVLDVFAPERVLVEGPARDRRTESIDSLSRSRFADGAPEHCAELALDQVWLNTQTNASWRVEDLAPCPGEAAVLMRAVDGAHAGKAIVVRVGQIHDQGLLLRQPRGRAA